MCVHGSVAGSEALRRGFERQTVAPGLLHVEAFGVPDVCLQPFVLPLSAIELQQQVPVSATRSTAPASGQLLLLFLWCTLTSLGLDTQTHAVCETWVVKSLLKCDDTSLPPIIPTAVDDHLFRNML